MAGKLLNMLKRLKLLNILFSFLTIQFDFELLKVLNMLNNFLRTQFDF